MPGPTPRRPDGYADGYGSARGTQCASAVSVLPIDTTASVVHWKGTKFRGRGKHEGIAFTTEPKGTAPTVP